MAGRWGGLMATMSYCRFENTYHDLRDCLNALQEYDELSESEQKYCKMLIKVAKQIIQFEDTDPEYQYGDDE